MRVLQTYDHCIQVLIHQKKIRCSISGELRLWENESAQKWFLCASRLKLH